MRDVFICHAGEDKVSVARPLAEALRENKISYWLDEAEVKWGASITGEINKGLKSSRYVLVILSPAFLKKNWPQRELNAALSQESSSGEVKVLPLMVGGARAIEMIRQQYPLLDDKAYLKWNGNPEVVVKALKTRLAGKQRLSDSDFKPGGEAPIYIPPIKKAITQRERDLFLITSFAAIKRYFQAGLEQLEQSDEAIDTDFREIHNQKFICTIYLHGSMKNECKIWIGGMMSADGIAYSQGRLNASADRDNAYNELLLIDSGAHKPAFQLSIEITFGAAGGSKMRGLSPEEAAEALWKRFVAPLTH